MSPRSRTFSSTPSTISNARSKTTAAVAAEAAEAIVELQVSRFVETLAASTRTAPLKRLRAHGEHARADVLAKAQQQLANGHDPRAVLEFLAHALTNRLLHAPTIALREAALTGDTELARATDRLFPEEPGIETPGVEIVDSGLGTAKAAPHTRGDGR